jgi:hypothetical protein
VKTQRAVAIVAFLLLPGLGQAQPAAPAAPSAPAIVSQYRSLTPAAPAAPVVYTTCNGDKDQDASPKEESATAEPPPPECHHCSWPEVWGTVGFPIYITGSHMAPNGVSFYPLFAFDFDFNIGILPHKELYLFAENKFWTQRASPGVTNPSQGKFDFSKREYDFMLGGAWNYFNNFELRLEAYALNNLNRGDSLSSPYGFKDGVGIENRYYFGSADVYDVGRLSFVSIGYYPSKSLVGGDGSEFHPGLFARAYLTYDLPAIRSYGYFDGQYIGEKGVKPRLLELDVGLAARPFVRLPNLEFRVGYDITGDVQIDTTRNLVYGAIRIVY